MIAHQQDTAAYEPVLLYTLRNKVGLSVVLVDILANEVIERSSVAELVNIG